MLYSLYGIVEHSGSMRGGHYTAYVKVRSPQRRTEQPQRRNLAGKNGLCLSIKYSLFLYRFCVKSLCQYIYLKKDLYINQSIELYDCKKYVSPVHTNTLYLCEGLTLRNFEGGIYERKSSVVYIDVQCYIDVFSPVLTQGERLPFCDAQL